MMNNGLGKSGRFNHCHRRARARAVRIDHAYFLCQDRRRAFDFAKCFGNAAGSAESGDYGNRADFNGFYNVAGR